MNLEDHDILISTILMPYESSLYSEFLIKIYKCFQINIALRVLLEYKFLYINTSFNIRDIWTRT